jgi:O-antigen/teichoic acid export membrane protein
VKIVTSALATPLLARILGTAGYGRYAYYLAVMMLASPIANLGTSQSITRFVAEHEDNRALRSKIALSAGKTNLLATAVVCGLLLAFLATGPQSKPSTLSLAIIVVTSIALEQVWYFGRGILYGIHREELATLPAAAGAALAPILGIALALMGWGVLGVMAGILAANLLCALLTFIHVNRFFDWTKNEDMPAFTKEIFRFGAHSMLFVALSMVLYKTGIILVRTFASDADAGIYAAALQWTEFTWLVPIAFEGVMLQATARLWAEHRLPEIALLLARVLRYTTLATGFLLLYVFVFADKIIILYFGARFVDTSIPLRIIVPGVLSFSLARVVWPVIQARGQVSRLVAIIGFASLINLILGLLFIPRWQATGAGVATTISYGGVVFLYARLLRKQGIRAFRGFPAWRFLMLFSVSIAAMAPVSIFLHSPLASVIAGLFVVTIIYVCGAVRLRLMSTHEAGDIIETLPAGVRYFVAPPFHLFLPFLVRLEGNLKSEGSA